MARCPLSDLIAGSARRRAARVTLLASSILIAVWLLCVPQAALADTFTVDTVEDVADADPGTGGCDDGEGRCSLRAAIQEANALPGADEIVLSAYTYTLDISGVGEDASATGDLDIVTSDPLTITGDGQDVTIIDANAIDRVMDVKPGAGPVYLSDLTLRGGFPGNDEPYAVPGHGGGLRVGEECGDCGEPVLTAVTAERTTVTQNTGSVYGSGGGIAVASGAYLELFESNVLTNTAGDGHSGISNFGTVVIIDSTLSGNEQGVYDGAVGNDGTMTFDGSTYVHNDGGIESSGSLTINNSTYAHNDRGIESSGSLTIENSTYAHNAAGILSWGALTIENSTFSSNDEDAIHLAGGATATISHTTIVTSTSAGINFDEGTTAVLAQVLLSGNDQNCAGAVYALGQFNLSDDDSCSILGTNLIGDIWDALLGPLQDNGGKTETHALLAGSDAIDNGWSDFEGPPFTDQRGVGYPRLLGTAIDIGAYEYLPQVQAGPVFTVNRLSDEAGSCLVDWCTLRQAMDAANASPNGDGRDVIQFQISDVPDLTISPAYPLPVISEAVLLNGELNPAERIHLDGSFAGEGSGFTINSDDSAIVGFQISGFAEAGIAVLDGSSNTLEGNHISGNDGLGIDLGEDGVTEADIGDGDGGPNGLQNAPVLTSVAPAETGATRITGYLRSKSNLSYTLQFFTNSACDDSFYGEGANPIGDAYVVETVANGYGEFEVELASLPFGAAVTALATDSLGSTSEFSRCAVMGLNNDTWPRAQRLSLSAGTPTEPMTTTIQFIDKPGQSRWYKFSVSPGSTVQVKLTDLPANYDLTLYRDIQALHDELANPSNLTDLAELTAELATDAFAPESFADDAFAPESFAPESFAPESFAPESFAPESFAPESFAPESFAPESFAPESFAPESFAPESFAPESFAPESFAPESFAQELAYVSAQLRSLVGVSAFDGTADEIITVDTWENSGDYYVRVSGRNSTFSPLSAFNLNVTQNVGVCEGIDPSLPARTVAAVAGDYRTLILTDFGRMDASDPLMSALQSALASFASRDEVDGAVIDVGDDDAVAVASDQADTLTSCPAAKNLVANAIKDIVDAYWDVNPNLEYVVVVGNDDVIPFFRYPDRALLANEKNYQPPVGDDTTSYANLILGYVLGQDAYGSSVDLSLGNTTLPIPNLAVGRLVETPSDILTMLGAYDATVDAGTPGIVPMPVSALVTGYDFMDDTAQAVEANLAAGIGNAVNSLITPASLSPLSSDARVWTANDLRSQLLAERHDVVFLAGHFSAYSALAADYSTRLLASEVADAGVDLENVLIFSNGCHSGYNIVNEHGIPNVTVEPDWAQAFASKGATLIAGTGYQYGDTEFIKYNEEIYLNFSQALLEGTGAVPIGKAMATAKQRYLAEITQMRGIHEKAYHVTTLFGLPMLSIDMPDGRTTPIEPPSIVNSVAGATVDPGKTLGLTTSDIIVTFGLTENVVVLSSVTDDSTVSAAYFSGNDGVVSNPAEPVLPLTLYNVSVADTVLRGIGFRGGAYTDLADFLPLTGAATTEIRGVHPPFYSDVFYPVVPWQANYFDVLADPMDGVTRLAVTPNQYRSSASTSLTGFLRKWSEMGFRLYYNDNTTTYDAGSIPALAAPPTLSRIESTVGTDEVSFSVTVVGDPSAGIHEAWVTYTLCDGASCDGDWQAFDLVQNAENSTRWEGTLSLGGLPASSIRYMVHAANGVGLVSMATNLGEYYVPGIDPGDLTSGDPASPDPTMTGISFQAVPTSGAFGTSVTFTALLTTTTGPLAGRSVTFALGSQQQMTTTNASGLAHIELPVLGAAGTTDIRATYAGSIEYQPSDTSTTFTIVQQPTLMALSAADTTVDAGADTMLVATLTNADGDRLPEKSIYFVVDGDNGSYSLPAITNLIGEAALGTVPLPSGTYTVGAYFSGAVPLSGEILNLEDENYQDSLAIGDLTVVGTPPVDPTLEISADQVGVLPGETITVSARVLPAEAGHPINFAVVAGGGNLSAYWGMTDGSGTIAVTYTAGISPTVAQIDASISGTSVADSAYLYVSATTSTSLQERSSGDQHVTGELGSYGVVVQQNGAGTPWLGVARFGGNPCSQSNQPVIPLGDYVDVLLEDPTLVNSLAITVGYTIGIGTPALFWCNTDGEWQQISGVSLDTDAKTVTMTITDVTTPSLSELEGTPLVVGSQTPLTVTLSWFLAERVDDSVHFRWQTATESGTAGFIVLAEVDGQRVPLNDDLIVSPVIDSVQPTAYEYHAVTEATRYFLQELQIGGRSHYHGPYVLGTEYGASIGPGYMNVSPTIWLPIIQN